MVKKEGRTIAACRRIEKGKIAHSSKLIVHRDNVKNIIKRGDKI